MTNKELSYISDTLNSEKSLIKKYRDYANICNDSQIKNLFTQMSNKHQDHYNKLLNQLG